MTWTFIEKGNNWGHTFYAWAGERLNVHGTNETSNALQLEQGMELFFKFPDGTVKKLPLGCQNRHFEESDMGRPYSGSTLEYFVVIENFGVKSLIPLESLEVWRGFLKRDPEVTPEKK